MDQVKIGKFIAQVRKEKQLTQRQLADLLNISDKTISKWETGRGLPDVSMILSLCEILDINANELLSGERIPDELYKEKAEEALLSFVSEKKRHINSMIYETVFLLFMAAACMVLINITTYVDMGNTGKMVLYISVGVIFLLTLITYGILDRKTGYFECTKCHTIFVPNAKTYVKSLMTVTPWSAKFKCPACQEATKCKRRFSR
ncbi:MAG: helix-turn-helix domain-containing protein [Clostridium sp.]|nr:helix-turn-helix domain-containing protein [Clostridium sp.]